MCSQLTLSTLESALLMDLSNYAQLVIDFTTDTSTMQQPNGFQVTLSQILLTATRNPQPPAPNTNNSTNSQPGPLFNYVQRIVNVIQGWASKYTSANIGFGIVVAIVFVAAVAGSILFVLSYRSLKLQRMRLSNLKQEAAEVEKQL